MIFKLDLETVNLVLASVATTIQIAGFVACYRIGVFTPLTKQLTKTIKKRGALR